MSQELRDLFMAERRGVLLVMEQDVPADPADVGFLGLVAVMPQANGFANLIEEFDRFGHSCISRSQDVAAYLHPS